MKPVAGVLVWVTVDVVCSCAHLHIQTSKPLVWRKIHFEADKQVALLVRMFVCRHSFSSHDDSVLVSDDLALLARDANATAIQVGDQNSIKSKQCFGESDVYGGVKVRPCAFECRMGFLPEDEDEVARLHIWLGTRGRLSPVIDVCRGPPVEAKLGRTSWSPSPRRTILCLSDIPFSMKISTFFFSLTVLSPLHFLHLITGGSVEGKFRSTERSCIPVFVLELDTVACAVRTNNLRHSNLASTNLKRHMSGHMP